MSYVSLLLREPPFRRLVQVALRRLPGSLRARAEFDVSPYPGYLVGVLAACAQAKEEGVAAITVAELGVAGGNGLVALEGFAIAAEQETGIGVNVVGFDHGTGLPPSTTNDYRDHLDHWQVADYPMDLHALTARLTRTVLRVGDLRDTIPAYLRETRTPLGFVSIDVDWYSSSVQALKLFGPTRITLRRTVVYLDDVNYRVSHRFAGELLAVAEFNEHHAAVKIDQWRGLRSQRAFPEADWIEKMYVAHDLDAITAAGNQPRAPRQCGLV